MSIKYLLMVLFLCSIGFAAKAEDGCLVSDGYLYYDYKGEFQNTPSYKKNASKVSFYSTFCREYEGICKVEKNPNTNAYDWGALYTFSFVDCPLDNHMATMLALSGGIGFFFLKRKKK